MAGCRASNVPAIRDAIVFMGSARPHYRRGRQFKAMEFAENVPEHFAGADDSWLPGGARSFFFRPSNRLELSCGLY